MSEECFMVFSKQVPSIPNHELFQTNFPPLIDMEIDWTNYDVNFLTHEVPLGDVKEWSSTFTLTQPVSDCSKNDGVVPVLFNPSIVFNDVILEHGLEENVDCRIADEKFNTFILEKVRQKCLNYGDSQDMQRVKDLIERAFNRCDKMCRGDNCKCEGIRKHVRLKAIDSQEPVESNDKEENLLRKVLFKHSLDCEFQECQVPLCQEIKNHLKEGFLVNPYDESVFPADEQYHVVFSSLQTFSVKSIIQINSDLVCIHKKLIKKGQFGAVYACWLLSNKDRGEARMAVKKMTNERSFPVIKHAMILLSNLGESTNILIPSLVLESPRVWYQVMILGDMDLSFVVKNGPLSDNLIAHLLHGVLIGVWYLHHRNYVHCDLKLANILVKDYKAVICDIDFVKKEDAKCIGGTAEFAAPEVWDGVANKPLDIHCIGLVLASLIGISISLSIDNNDTKEVKQSKIINRNRKVYQELRGKRNKFAEIFRECTQEHPSARPLIEQLCANTLFKVKVETVSHEIDQIHLKREAMENNPEDDLPKKIVKKFINQTLEKLPIRFSDGTR